MSEEIKSYHNTTHVDEPERKKRNLKATKQDREILAFMKANPDEWMTSITLMANNVLKGNVPETSYRRSLSNLKKLGLITQSPIMVQGNYDREIGQYKALQDWPEIFF